MEHMNAYPATEILGATRRPCILRVEFNSVQLRSGYWVKVQRYNHVTGKASGFFKPVPQENATVFECPMDAARYASRMKLCSNETVRISPF